MYTLVAIASSAGGVPALAAVLGHLPRGFPLPIAVVQHIDPTHESFLADILSRRTPLMVRQAADGDQLVAGTVYIAPPASHLEIASDASCRRIYLSHTKPLHFLRPSADRLFESAATACGSVIGVVLTGNGSDGASGLRAIKREGGIVIAQDAATAQFSGMPSAAIDTGEVDYVLPLDAIAPALVRLAESTESDERQRREPN